MNIIIIDYGLGNLASVYNALKFLGADAKISESPFDVEKADKLVLPGVGAFKDCIKGLKKRNLIEAIKNALTSGKMYLGICLGLQILFEESEEGRANGLGVLKGKVKRFKGEKGVKVPHIGWNNVNQMPKAKGQILMKNIEDRAYFYFDHSYYADPDKENIIAATTDYGINFTSAICKNNIYGVQFHPERSQNLGLLVLKNFIAL